MIAGWIQLGISILAIGTSIYQTGVIVDRAASELDGFMKICMHEGISIKGECVCSHPWGGSECEIDLCVNGIALRHSITNDTGDPWGCSCLKRQKWHGILCDTCHTQNYTETQCLGECEENFYGPLCSKFCERESTCSNHGECSEEGECVCDLGYDGDKCQYPNECHYTDRYTGGVPDLRNLGFPTPCICNKFHAGPTCEESVPISVEVEVRVFGMGRPSASVIFPSQEVSASIPAPEVIMPNGLSVVDTGIAGMPSASAMKGTRVERAPVPKNCIHGVCSDDLDSVCECFDNFTRGPPSTSVNARFCDTCQDDFYPKVGDNKCTKECGFECEGVCDLNGVCQCAEGQTGPKCDECKDAYWPKDSTCPRTKCLLHRPDPCPRNGQRDKCGDCVCSGNVSSSCNECIPDHFGDNCEIYCVAEVTCAGHGVCAEGGCVCDEGFFGPSCLEECSPTTCKHGGECVSFDGADEVWADPLKNFGKSACVCDVGYFGQNCNFFCPRENGGSVCGGGKSKCLIQTTEQECYQDSDCDDNYFCDDLPFPLVDSCRNTWLQDAHFFCLEFLQYEYRCGETLEDLTYMQGTEKITCEVAQGEPFKEVCRNFTFSNCTEEFDLDRLEIVAPFLQTPLKRCKNPQDGFDDLLLEECGFLEEQPAYGYSTFEEALEASADQFVSTQFWKAAPPALRCGFQQFEPKSN